MSQQYWWQRCTSEHHLEPTAGKDVQGGKAVGPQVAQTTPPGDKALPTSAPQHPLSCPPLGEPRKTQRWGPRTDVLAVVPSGRFWPGGQKAAGSRWAAQPRRAHSLVLPDVPQSGLRSPEDTVTVTHWGPTLTHKTHPFITVMTKARTSMSSWPGMKMRMSPGAPDRCTCKDCFTAAST